MRRNSNKKAAPVRGTTASNSNCRNCTTCSCGKQATLFDLPAPVTVGGGLVDYLLTHPGRARQDRLAGLLQTNRREIRKQSQDSDGSVLFFSQTYDGGLTHIVHANPVEFRQYRAEFESRIRSMRDRLNASIALWISMGRPL